MSAERIPGNAAALLLGRLIGAGAMVVVVSIAAHRLSVRDFGLVVSTMAAGFLANTVVTFGSDTVVVRAVAAGRTDAQAVVTATLRLQLLAALGFVIAAIVAAGAGVSTGLLLIQALGLIPLAIVTVAGAILRGGQRMGPILVATTVGGAATVAATIVGFAVGDGPVVPLVAVVVGSVVTATIVGGAARTVLPMNLAGAAATKAVQRETAPFGAMVVLAAIGAQGGLLLVELLADEPSGGYGVAVRLAEGAGLLPAAVIGALFPAIVAGAGLDARQRLWVAWLLRYAVAAAIALAVGASVLNRLLFDSQPGAVALIRVLAIGMVLSVGRSQLSVELIAQGRERAVLMGALAGTAVFLVVGAAVARHSGAVGVAWAQVAGIATTIAVLIGYRSDAARSRQVQADA